MHSTDRTYSLPAGEHGVLVGYSGSPASVRALEYGARAARLRGETVTVCHIWEWPRPTLPGEAFPAKLSYDRACRLVGDGVARARQILAPSRPGKLLVTGAAPTGLCELSRQAVMTVVGSHGSGQAHSVALGPVSAYLAARNDRPVIVVQASAPRLAAVGRLPWLPVRTARPAPTRPSGSHSRKRTRGAFRFV